MAKTEFMKAYSNLIEDERNGVLIVITGKPYSWNRAYDEIKNDTELGKQILKKLVKLGILHEV